jgi:hypothetical protein
MYAYSYFKFCVFLKRLSVFKFVLDMFSSKMLRNFVTVHLSSDSKASATRSEERAKTFGCRLPLFVTS